MTRFLLYLWLVAVLAVGTLYVLHPVRDKNYHKTLDRWHTIIEEVF
jgi:hypothetical protein